MLHHNASATCKCGATQARLGKHWLRHTTHCEDWIADHVHLFTSSLPEVAAVPLEPISTLGDPPSSGVDQEPMTQSKIGSQNRVDNSVTNWSDLDIDASPSIPVSPQVEDISQLNQEIRQTRRPRPIADIIPSLPQPPITISPDTSGEGDQEAETATATRRRTVRLLVWHETATDVFGVYRKYRHPPSLAPLIPNTNPFATIETLSAQLDSNNLASVIQNIISPFPNLTTFRLAHWFFTGSSNKSLPERNRLVNSVLLAPGFTVEHLGDQSLKTFDKALDQLENEGAEDLLGIHSGDGWITKDIYISLPQAASRARRNISTTKSETYSEFGHQVCIPGFLHRNLVKVIIARFTSPTNNSYSLHYIPYREHWRPSSNLPEERIYDELYTSDDWLEEHAAVQRLPPIEGCTRDRAIAALMFSSDATHLAQVGNTSLWPVYLTFGNISKYDRCKVSNQLMEHVAYLLSGAAKTQIEALLGNKAISSTLAPHIKRKIFHSCWTQLLDEEFVLAYKEGIPIKCTDGVDRRIYPRIFTYSTDYQERVIVGGVRDFGNNPDILDLVKKKDLHNLGTREDRRLRIERPRIDDSETRALILEARRKIYAERYAINSQQVESLLKPTSLVPTINAFSKQLGEFPTFDIYKILIPDLLHECELGTWKGLYTHLVRMLNTRGAAFVALFNRRFRSITTFPPDTIRHFAQDISEMRHLAARDYEDILQCAIPCFEGLFSDEHNSEIWVIIFTMAQWHALAKLRMHTSSTVKALDDHTTVLGRRMRRFQKSTAAAFKTLETNQEFDARKRRHDRAALAAGSTSVSLLERKAKTLSLNTFKFHSHGDYPLAITRVGTTDNWTTQNTELEHKRGKMYARRTNQIQLVEGVGKIERRVAKLTARQNALERLEKSAQFNEHREVALVSGAEATSDSMHYQIGIRGTTMRFVDFFHDRQGDRAIANFMVDLQNHVLNRLHNPNNVGICDLDFSDPDRRTISFTSGAMYSHATLRIEYTSYDVRRSYDTINPRFKHYFVMMLSGDENPDHPFWYAKVLGIFHVNVLWHSEGCSTTRRIDFLWIQWMQLVQSGSWSRCTLDQVEYVPDNSYCDQYGFLDPACVIRACHMIPTFLFGQTSSLEPELDDTTGETWASYYVNRFVDRDMFMRYWGGGIGHGTGAGTGAGDADGVSVGMRGMDLGDEEVDKEVEVLSDGSTSSSLDDEDQWEGSGSESEDLGASF